MSGYVKRIALIKALNAGYSADGGGVKGIVRCEAYAGYFKAEASLINFAPLSEGVYRIGITDGIYTAVFDAPMYEGECAADPSGGFACLIAFCRNGKTVPVASAVCGDCERYLALAQSAIERAEAQPAEEYDDEAIAGENYYELEADENGGSVRADEEEQAGSGSREDENGSGACEGAPPGAAEKDGEQPEKIRCSTSSFRIGGSPQEDDPAAPPSLAGGGFYERMSGDIKKIFSTYARAAAIEDVIEGSRWAKITYGSNSHYAFGVIYDGGNAKYLCYAVPVPAGAPCPESLKGRAAYVPVDGGGYWVMYQDASTGISITVENM